ncbi:MAG: hypothetical protein U5N85_00200 [Arcicella sp.]|nr:hypothetical protein [Arcicella sp.]
MKEKELSSKTLVRLTNFRIGKADSGEEEKDEKGERSIGGRKSVRCTNLFY